MNEMDLSTPMVVDCERCVVRCPAVCADCVVSVLLGPPDDQVTFDAQERAALDRLAESGLVPPLRLVVAMSDPHAVGDAG